MEARFIRHDDVTGWLDALSEKHVVLAPMWDDSAVTFRPYVKGRTPLLDRAAVMAPKEGVFPQNEVLLRYRYEKDPENLERTRVSVTETLPKETTVVVGARPCGTRGVSVLDRVYNCDKVRDPYYAKRRENTMYVTMACTRVDSTCFCHEVGSHPADPEASDVLLVPVPEGYVAEPVTERGETLLDFPFFSPAGEDRLREAEETKRRTRDKLPAPHDYSDAEKSLTAVFNDMEFWEEQAAKCISCGACAYLCPTCYCFNITDESAGLTGKRVRTWDNCMSFQFTLEGSGHNPRPTKAHRMRNRVNHKFAYYTELHGVPACCGCGRCIKSCPVGVDIRAMVQAAQQRAAQNAVQKTEDASDER